MQNPSLKIAFFTSFSHNVGTYFRFHNLAIGLQKLGHRVVIFSADGNNTLPNRTEVRDGVEYRITKGDKLQSLFGGATNPITAIKRLFGDGYSDFDVYHLFQPSLSAVLPVLFHRRKARLAIYDWDDLHIGGLLAKPANSFRERYQKALYAYLETVLPAKVKKVSTCSHFLEKLAKERGAKETGIFYNGYWTYQKPEKFYSRKNLGLNEDSIYLGFMGRTINELDWCFSALENTIKTNPNVRMGLCGMPEAALSGLKPEVRDRIDYLGKLDLDGVRAFAAAIDIALLPLEEDLFNNSRFPIKFAEYMAAGLPVVCSNVGELTHFVNRWSWVHNAEKGKVSFIAAVDKVVEQCQLGTLDVVNMDVIGNEFEWTNIAGKLGIFYSDLLAGN